MTSITQEKLKELLHYDPLTGIFTWVVDRRPGIKAGDVAGTLRADGYIRIMVDGQRHYANHLAWLFMTGKFPDDEVDHKDRVRSNNVWENLRDATKSQNCANRASPLPDRPNSLRGVTGYGRRFKAQIRVRQETIYLGIHDTAEEAHAAYLDAAREYFGEFVADNDNQAAATAAA